MGRHRSTSPHHHPEQKDGLETITLVWETDLWIWWRKLYLPQALEQCKPLHRQMPEVLHDADLIHDMQTALRIAVAASMNEFASPEHHADTYVNLVWHCRRIGIGV
jgi:hypothetical protein